jgi:hypothetical protein
MKLGTYLDGLFFVLVLLDHIDCFLDVAEHHVAVAIVGLYRHRSVLVRFLGFFKLCKDPLT